MINAVLLISLTIFRALGLREHEAPTLSNIGVVYSALGDKEKALEYFLKSLKFMEELEDIDGVANGLNNVAVIYEEMKNFSKAMEYHKKSLRLNRSQLNDRGVSASLYNIALIYKSQKDYQNAVSYIDSAMFLAKEQGALESIKEHYATLSEIYYEKNDFKKSLHYYTLLFALKDTLLNKDRNKQIVEMSTKYQTEKKEKENEILKQQNDLQNLSINRQKIINYSVTLGLLLVICLAFFIYKGYKQKQKANFQLEEKNLLIEEKNKIVEEKNKIVEEKNKDITDSIRYAKRLQSAILKPEHEIKDYFNDAFILFKPKDIVSGDFYWFEKFGRLSLVAAADCTGHGVPGAFMSIIGCNLLSQAVNEYAITQPAAILNSVNKGLSKVLQQKTDKIGVSDGMDIALCSFDPDKMILQYSGAYNSLWLVRDGIMQEYKANKFPVGAFVDNQVRIFDNHEVAVQAGDMVYLFSDGFPDQFGGPAGKKFKYKKLQELLIKNSTYSAAVQREALDAAFANWIGNFEQVDDVLIIGVKI
ncbi:MAG: tetratricopeptide repeat protein [Bacteroidota bacterium]|nr:tetratricopeptide repeat protein [Bacteroidota bacterium]